MPNPAKPIEQKRLLGNPGKRAMPVASGYIEGGYIEPMRPLEYAGKQLWDSAMTTGAQWIARHTDTHLLLITCEQLDRREQLRSLLVDEPTDKNLLMRLLDLERAISSSLSLLGFTPSDRTRLGLAEVKAKSKLEELIALKENRNG
jgi:hypothetical protein